MAGHDIAVRHSAVALTTHMTLISGDQLIDVTADLRYASRDTYAVRVSLSVADSPAVEWVFARELLRDGLVHPAGSGDIQIFPAVGGIVIDLTSPHGQARLLADASDISDFVDRMYDLVADGDEDRFFSMDHELRLLMVNSPTGSLEA
jgi:hypothetical protein